MATAELTASQSDALRELKENVQDILHKHLGRVKGEEDDDFLLRWLQARRFDVGKAEKMFRDSYTWRQQNAVDTILQDFQPPKAFEDFEPGGITGVDKTGAPIFVLSMGHFDPRGYIKCFTKETYLRLQIFKMEVLLQEWLPDYSKKAAGKISNKMTLLFDTKGMGMRHMYPPLMELDQLTQRMYEDHYPEMLNHIFVLHAPQIFHVMMKIFKPLIDPATFNKIQILGKNYQQELLTHMEADQFPAKFGGSLTDPDGNPACVTMIKQGGMVPPEYYLVPTVELTPATVLCGASLYLQLNVEAVGMVIRWQFVTDDRDIGFGIFRKKEGADGKKWKKNLIAVQEIRRVHSQLACEKGYLVCDTAGTYIFQFDNSYSWTRNKKVRYFVAVFKPDEEMQDADVEVAEEAAGLEDMLTDVADKELLRKAMEAEATGKVSDDESIG